VPLRLGLWVAGKSSIDRVGLAVEGRSWKKTLEMKLFEQLDAIA